MQALRGMSKADTLRLVEIEAYVATGKRPDGLQVTDEWVDEAIKFLARELRPTLDAWVEMGAQVDRYMPVVIAAGKLSRARKQGRNGQALRPFYRELDESLRNEAARAPKKPEITEEEGV